MVCDTLRHAMDIETYAAQHRRIGNYGLVAPGTWMEERTSRNAESLTATRALYEDYGRWCMARRSALGSRRAFSDWLVKQGVELVRGTAGVRLSRGIALKAVRK